MTTGFQPLQGQSCHFRQLAQNRTFGDLDLSCFGGKSGLRVDLGKVKGYSSDASQDLQANHDTSNSTINYENKFDKNFRLRVIAFLAGAWIGKLYNNLVSSDYIGNGNVIWVYSILPAATGFGGVRADWDGAVDLAMAAWKGIPNACIKFQRTLNPSQADITVVNGAAKPLGASMFGWAGQPLLDGVSFHTVWINMQYPNVQATLNGAATG